MLKLVSAIGKCSKGEMRGCLMGLYLIDDAFVTQIPLDLMNDVILDFNVLDEILSTQLLQLSEQQGLDMCWDVDCADRKVVDLVPGAGEDFFSQLDKDDDLLLQGQILREKVDIKPLKPTILTSVRDMGIQMAWTDNFDEYLSAFSFFLEHSYMIQDVIDEDDIMELMETVTMTLITKGAQDEVQENRERFT